MRRDGDIGAGADRTGLGASVRPLRAGEWTALADIERECFGDHGYSRYFLRMVPILFDGTCLVAERNGVPCGYVLGALEQARPRIGWILSLAVLPNLRNRRIGTELARRCVTSLREAGAGCIRLTVEPNNQPALRSYRRLGFVADERDQDQGPDFFGAGKSRLVMSLELDRKHRR